MAETGKFLYHVTANIDLRLWPWPSIDLGRARVNQQKSQMWPSIGPVLDLVRCSIGQTHKYWTN